jgi:hypothetical protein
VLDSKQAISSSPAASGLIGDRDFLSCSEAAIMSGLRDGAGLYVAPSPSTRECRHHASAIQGVFVRRARKRRYQVRPVAVRTKGNYVPGVAPRTFHAMADAVAHDEVRSRCVVRGTSWTGHVRTCRESFSGVRTANMCRQAAASRCPTAHPHAC